VGGSRAYAAGMQPPVESERLQQAAARLWRAMGCQS
jgi:hypothetical protein